MSESQIKRANKNRAKLRDFSGNLNEWADVIILIRRNEAFEEPRDTGRVPNRVSPSFLYVIKDAGIAKGGL